MLSTDVQTIEGIIGYTFQNKVFLVRAFTHSSFANEHKNEESYERLEFLGDAALNYFIGLYLYDTFPTMAEGKLSKVRAGTVDRQTISEVVDELGLLPFMRTGKGNTDLVGGASVKVKCDLFEAIVGAIIIDNNEDLTEAKAFVYRFLENKISLSNGDYKSRLLEKCAKEGKKAEFMTGETGTDKEKRFLSTLVIEEQVAATGYGENKKAAERDAAKNYLKSF